MALAYGYGAHAGFGFAFLNFFGTVLFFIFMLFVIKMMFKGMKYSGRGSWSVPWRESSRAWIDDGPKAHNDEAIQVARTRLANSEISPEEFDVIKQGLKDSDTSYSKSPYQHDDALKTARLRFAKGELTLEEYETVLKALS